MLSANTQGSQTLSYEPKDLTGKNPYKPPREPFDFMVWLGVWIYLLAWVGGVMWIIADW